MPPSEKKPVFLYDTTLRDGTQGQGFHLSSLDKMRIARRLDAFGMHYIEGGWPGSNPKDVEFFEEARKQSWKHAKIVAFGSTRRAQVKVEDDPQIRTLLEAGTPVITFFGKSWKLHVTDVLRTTPEENRAMIEDTAAHFKAHGKEVIYDAEHFFDGYKDDPEHALATLRAAADGGVDIAVLCDTNGGTLPSEVFEICRKVQATVDVPIGIHTHDDCGLGVANAMVAVSAGAVQVQGTVNGYGERVGNCNLTTLIPNLQLKLGREVVRDLSALHELATFVDDTANCAHDPKQPYVGSNAFAHKGGMHVNAVQKLSRTYEHIDPVLVGNRQEVLVSELSGQSNILMKAEQLGLPLEKGSEAVMRLLQRVKEMEKEGYAFEAAGASLELLIRKEIDRYREPFELVQYGCDFRHFEDKHEPVLEATVKLRLNGVEEYAVANGNGPVAALDAAMRKCVRPFYPEIDEVHLRDYKVRIIDGKAATEAVTRVLVVSSDGQRVWGTVGVSENIIEASWIALIDGVDAYLQRVRGEG